MILLNDFQRQWADTSADVLRAVEAVGASGWYILGEQVRGFEHDLAAYWGLPHTVGVASGLDALELSLRALGCGAGDLVLTSPISAFATALAIVKVGAVPVFADCDARGLVDLDACAALLAAHPEIRYFVPVHLYGAALDAGRLAALRDRYELKVVEDCAQSIGTPGTGLTGACAAASFYPTKNLGAMGDGGAVLTRDAQLAERIRQLRDYGQTAKYRHEVIGYNSRLDELHAAILRTAFLPRLNDWTARRREIAAAYLAGIRNFELPVREGNGHLFPVLVDAARKPEIMAHFRERGILTGEHYPQALIEQPALAGRVSPLSSPCPRAIEFCRRELSLPIHPYLTDSEIDAVIGAANTV